ncbi:MAG: glycosyltransferase, partial [Patescibacteria group bacterium]
FAQKHSGFRVLKEPHRGKGGTVIAGMLASKGEYALFADMDQSTPINQIEKFIPKFKEGFDVVIGSRTGREGAPIIRKLSAIGFALLRAVILRLPYKDTQAGFKAFRREAAVTIFSKMQNLLERRQEGTSLSAGFDTEMLYLARKMKFKTVEVPIEWYYKEGTNKNIIKESWYGLRGVIAVRLKAMTGYYKLK